MATYAIGDIQGCYLELQSLLKTIAFDPAHDQLWFVGDLVNRGPQSLEVLRLVKSLGNAAITVLGNHDLHLLAVATGVAKIHHGDTLDEVLSAPDCDELLTWLRHRPLLHVAGQFVMVHAGLLPDWTIKQASKLAREVEATLRSDDYVTFFQQMYGNQPNAWNAKLRGNKRRRLIINAMTRMRICNELGEMEFKFKGEVEHIPAGYQPWFTLPQRASRDETIIFGHWSALGLLMQNNVIALDTGCLWGGTLTAIRLEDQEIFQVACASGDKIDFF
ncbi:MAG: symmetrical bis(5'-nucleosyl)-tetraphosphatase [Gallionella sp.]|nr:symmetrical bis(5'-nucleosyl)-tetraphosphatase [Gallionella sp.]MDD4960113.1 symmetrical bis(5'-nucleosyl)-tetraphosphatase [Gallionella sp.]